ncbi:peptidyl-prolyl isomerase D (cyclophilin D) [Ceratobasidium sp. AG-Ba]|nr:peptidyl-prolyl isomerase D (cyclophilin D) [Ceratobasidium sp. AG-Ba]
MTRTERAAYPRALAKDRSEARNGYDRSLKKGGAGGWGTLDDDIAVQQEDYDAHEREEARDEVNDAVTTSSGASDARKSPELPRRASITMTEEESKMPKSSALAHSSTVKWTWPQSLVPPRCFDFSPQPVLPALSNPNSNTINP